ncbi:MAG: hypothetical protein ACJ8C4_12295 [Gemmataceae bacterium]
MRSFATLAMFVFSATLSAQTPQDIVNRAVRAHGGESALNKTKFMTQRATGRVNFQGADVDAVREGKWALPERVLSDVEVTMQGKKVKFVLVLNGLTGWQATSGASPTDLSAATYDMLTDEAHVQWLCTILPLTRKDLTLSAVPPATSDSQQCPGVKVAKPGKPDTTLYFHPSTGLLVKAKFKGRGPGGALDKEFMFSDHKEIDGVKLPMKVQDFQMGTRMGEWTVKEYRFVDRFEPNTFKKL